MDQAGARSHDSEGREGPSGVGSSQLPPISGAMSTSSQGSETPVTVLRNDQVVRFQGVNDSPDDEDAAANGSLPAHAKASGSHVSITVPIQDGGSEVVYPLPFERLRPATGASDAKEDQGDSSLYTSGFFSRKLSQQDEHSEQIDYKPVAVKRVFSGAQQPESTELSSRHQTSYADIKRLASRVPSRIVESPPVAVKFDPDKPDWSQVRIHCSRYLFLCVLSE
jgi:hypothetical protein